MKVRLSVLAIAVVCSGCGEQGRSTPAQAYQRWQDRVVVATGIPFFGFRPPCATGWVGNKNVGYWDELPTDQCLKFNPPQRMRGLWRNDFEGSQFCAGSAKECSYVARRARSEPLVWLDFAKSQLNGFRREHPGGLYAVDFIGRRTSFRGAYGHMGGFDEEVLVDRMISMNELEAPKKRTDGTLK